jgi:hypothetical protein
MTTAKKGTVLVRLSVVEAGILAGSSAVVSIAGND